MAFDQNAIPNDLRPLNIVRTVPEEPRIAVATTAYQGFFPNQPHETTDNPPTSMPVFYPTAVPDARFLGVGYGNAVAAVPAVATGAWGSRMPITTPVGQASVKPVVGYGYSPNLGNMVVGNVVDQVSPNLSPNLGNMVVGNAVDQVSTDTGSGFGYSPNLGNMVVSAGHGIDHVHSNNDLSAGYGLIPNLGHKGSGNGVDQASDEGGDDSASGRKVKFLCSFGGKILPRPSDGVLRYVGGQTRIISLRREVTFNELVQKMVDTYGQPVVIKYQLPDEDLDALVSVSCPDDLVNMMDEYEKLLERSSDGSAKLRVFLFSASELDSSGLVQFGDLHDCGQKYVEAVNGVTDVGSGIMRKESIASATSTQNSDFSGSEAVDSLGPGQGGSTGPPSTSALSPRGNLVTSHEASPRMVCVDPNPAIYADSSALPLAIPVVNSSPSHASSPLEVESERAAPFTVPQQQMGVDLRQPGGDIPPPGPYMQTYVDPRQEAINRADYVPLPPHMGFPHPQLLGHPASVFHQQQLQENAAGVSPHQFIPAVHMTMAPSSSHVGARSTVVQPLIQPQQNRLERYPDDSTFGTRVVQLPVDQSYNVYHPQVRPAAVVGGTYGWPPVPPPREHVVFSDGPVDGMMETLRIRPTEVYLNNKHNMSPVDRLRNEDTLDGRPQQLAGREVLLDNTFSKPPMALDTNQIKTAELLPCSNTEVPYMNNSRPLESYEVAPAPILGNPISYLQSKVGDAEAVSSNVDTQSSTSASGRVGDVQDSPNSLFSNRDPWNLGQDAQFPPRHNEVATQKEAFLPRDPFTENPFGNIGDMVTYAWSENAVSQPLSTGNIDFNPEHTSSKKGSAEELIKQELQAVAEGVASSIFESDTPSNPDSSVQENIESVYERNQEREVPNNDVEVQNKTKIEGFKNKVPEKVNFGFPLSDGIGRLQIIQNSDLEELRELGSGTFGTVYHGKWRGTDVAIKRINDRCFAGKPSEQERMIDDFWNEAIKLADLHHPNVVAFYGVVLDGPGGFVATVTEYMVNGSLRNALQKNERNLDKRKRLLIAMDVAFGMEYLHGKNIVHFDLKSDNLLVNLRDPHRPICKVGDLGLSKMKCQTLISGGVRGTLPWMAPELLNGSSNLVSEKVDVFSFAIVMWELLTGDEPYADLHYGAIIGGIVSNTLRPPVPESCDQDWRSLMERCWSSEPSERPSFTEIANELRSMAAKIPPKGQQNQPQQQQAQN